MRQILLVTVLLAASAALAQPAASDAVILQNRAADVVLVLQGKLPAEKVFEPGFLKEIPVAKIAELEASLEDQFGPLQSAEALVQTGPAAASFKLRFAKGLATVLMRIEPDAPNRVIALRITNVVTLGDTPQRIAADFAALPGQAGFAVIQLTPQGPQTVFSQKPAQQFAVGSTFKLYVLDALAEDVARGKRKWSDVVPLGRPSLPSGSTRNWPRGAPITLSTLATLMISESDNTATDTLITLLGRDAIAARVRATGHSDPARILPFLSTLEAFALKAGPAAEARAYAASGDAQQTAQLVKLDRTLDAAKVDATVFSQGTPVRIDSIEWFASANDLAGVLQSLQRRKDPQVMAILAVNPAIDPSDFAKVGFKGGSEPGVLNLTWLVQNKAGNWYVVTASWNDLEKDVDQPRFLALGNRLLAQIK